MQQTRSHHLFKRYSLWFILVFLIMGISYLFISLSLSNHYLQQVQTRIHIHVADSIIQDHQLVNQGQLSQAAIASTFNRYMQLNPHLEIYLTDLNGKILQYSADAKKIKRHQIETLPLRAQLNKDTLNKPEFPMGDDPRSLSGKKPFSVAYLPNKEHPEGFLYVIIQDSIEQEANRQLQESILLKLSAWSFLSSLVIGLLLGGVLFYHLAKRIGNLSQTITHFKEQPEQPITPPKQIKDEIDLLENTFMEMSVQIQQQMRQLSHTDQQRRFMISSLSHDLRTPLTNMLGYMEQLTQTQPSEYLNIAYQNGLKLKHYLDQLFEFAKLDMDSFKLNQQALSLSEFCFDIFKQYETTYPTQKWHIKIQQHILYEFDVNQLERAIHNLVDNAIKHGQGSITLGLEQKADTIQFKVCDEGPVLNQNDEPLAFDLFKPSALTFKKNQDVSSGSGLGLAIVNSIAEKHHGHLEYCRDENQNCFQISLPLNTQWSIQK